MSSNFLRCSRERAIKPSQRLREADNDGGTDTEGRSARAKKPRLTTDAPVAQRPGSGLGPSTSKQQNIPVEQDDDSDADSVQLIGEVPHAAHRIESPPDIDRDHSVQPSSPPQTSQALSASFGLVSHA